MYPGISKAQPPPPHPFQAIVCSLVGFPWFNGPLGDLQAAVAAAAALRPHRQFSIDTSRPAVSRRTAASVFCFCGGHCKVKHCRLLGYGICVVELLSESFPSGLQSQ